MKVHGFLLLAVCWVHTILPLAAQSSMQTIINDIKKTYAPDGRVAIFDVRIDGTQRLVGKTNLPEAKEALLKKLDNEGFRYENTIELLPAKQLGETTHALVRISVANLRTQPRDPAELASQALLGTPVKVLDQDRNWYLVQTPDHYIAWVDWGGIVLLTQAQLNDWQAVPKLIVTAPYATVFQQPDTESMPLSDVVMGNIVRLVGTKDNYYEVTFPDGRKGFLPSSQGQPFDRWINERVLTEASLVQTAKRMMGIPYLWGGTSYKGMDCSGFTKTIFYLHGWVLPRDASQQVHAGTLVEPGTDWASLRVGDLLFFGTAATENSPERVTHVGMWIGNKEFIHASGYIRIGSVDPTQTHYDKVNHERFLRAKRLLGSPLGIGFLTNDGFVRK